ncbi:4Fe-4S dicluster domain-containing protein [Marispirochaeta aestuarii]|uniref:4Fe-4S dicluster domain-containing protein n=1 Tax=Marispirochaeta aestuarii TaxID=1963862 RepID=UPI0029C94F5D|nr:4Fe-4S dicluster domain-containing protein [Marispirochaeta aestuarii]
MSETQSQLLNQKITRRDFLKYTGISAIGATTMSWLLPGCASKDIKVFETADGMIIHESARCTGCLVCEATCSVGNDGKASQITARIKVSQNYAYGPKGVRGDWVNGPGEMGNFSLVADTCRQCEQPACALACPENAIFEHEGTGAREVDPEKCVGCGTCVRACPWGIPTLDPETNVSTKCILCHGYTACVKDCPTGALQYVSWEDAIQKYKEHFQV